MDETIYGIVNQFGQAPPLLKADFAKHLQDTRIWG